MPTPNDSEETARLQVERQRWERERLAPILKRAPEQREAFQTISGQGVERLYTPEDVADLDYVRDLGFPGEYPFTRGVQPTMYRGRFWTMRQYAGFASAEESNRRYRYLLDHGQTGLSVAFDLPTQMGYDSDHPLAEGEVGKVGVAIASIEDMQRLFDGIPLDQVSTSMTINATAAIILAMYVVAARRQGVPSDKLNGTVQNDILKEYMARGTHIYPPRPSLRLVVDLIAYCRDFLPNWNTISISGYHIREAGSTAVQEIAFTLANGMTYVEHALRAGLNVDEFAPRLSFFFNAHNDFFEEIAKYRAARRRWARIMRERFGAKDPRAWMLRFHAQTAGSSLTAQQPDNNVVRTTLQALAAALGGCQSLHSNSLDEALALPSEHSARLALRTQQIIAHESGIASTIDPLGGSYFVERLTSDLEAAAEDYLHQIEDQGGVLTALEHGFFHREIADSAYRYQQRVERGEEVIVGVNRFVEEQQMSIPVLRVDPQVAVAQRQRLADLRSRRDNALVAARLAALREAATGTTNLMPLIVDAVESQATLGEISDALRDVFGVYREVGAA